MTEALVDELRPEVALADLGVRPELLTSEERRCLDIEGLVVFEDVIPDDQLLALREKIDERLEAQRPENLSDEEIRAKAALSRETFETLARKNRSHPYFDEWSPGWFAELNVGLKRMADSYAAAVEADDVAAMRTIMEEGFHMGGGFFDGGDRVEGPLFETDPLFDLTISSSRVLSAVAHVLGPMFHLLNVVCRCPRPGQGQQALHRTEYSARRIATTLWLIDDMTLGNGPTRVVPGSHLRSDGPPPEMEGDPTRSHPEEILLTGKAGSVIVFDDRTWHGGSLHKGGGARRVVISSFVQRALYPSIALNHPEETLARLSPGQVWLLHPKLEPQGLAV